MMSNLGSTAPPLLTLRSEHLQRLQQGDVFDLAVIGAGATGLGVALDAAARGLKVLVLESHDIAKGTSSRATKLVHGGVRYLARGNFELVREALHERSILLHNAPHLAQALPFVLPAYRWWERAYYGAGLKLYDILAGRAKLGATAFLSRDHAAQCLPGVKPTGLRGGVQYWDGQFNDARLALALARSAAARGALLINYCPVTQLVHEAGKLVGLICQDQETSKNYSVRVRCIVNATGVWVDALRQMDGAAQGVAAVPPIVAPSQGVHLVVDRSFLPAPKMCKTTDQTPHALIVPKTADGRVLFAIPWLGHTLLGTTDTARDDAPREPMAFDEEIRFILDEAGRYLNRAPTRADVTSIWVGLRPLVKHHDDDAHNTKSMNREHAVLVSASGLVTVTGGKWTTYRAMAEDVLDKCFEKGLLPSSAHGMTRDLPLIGSPADSDALPFYSLSAPQGIHQWGSEQAQVLALPGADHDLGGGLLEAMVRFSARYEYARTVEDMLARRWRLLFLDARTAKGLADAVGVILQLETGVDPQIEAFKLLADQYILA